MGAFSLQYKITPASSQVHLAIQNNLDIIIYIGLRSSAKKYKQVNFSKGWFFFSINESSQDTNRWTMPKCWGDALNRIFFIRVCTLICAYKGRIKILLCSVKRVECLFVLTFIHCCLLERKTSPWQLLEGLILSRTNEIRRQFELSSILDPPRLLDPAGTIFMQLQHELEQIMTKMWRKSSWDQVSIPDTWADTDNPDWPRESWWETARCYAHTITLTGVITAST